VLKDELAPTDLQTWQVPGRPAHRVDRARLRARWREDRFVQPPPVDPQLTPPAVAPPPRTTALSWFQVNR
jgi:hypothetical protein